MWESGSVTSVLVAGCNGNRISKRRREEEIRALDGCSLANSDFL